MPGFVFHRSVSIMASEITSNSTVCQQLVQANIKINIKAAQSQPFVWRIHGLVDSPHKGAVIRKVFTCYDVIILCSDQRGSSDAKCGHLNFNQLLRSHNARKRKGAPKYGVHFTNDLPTQSIQWKNRFGIIQIIIMWSLQNFVRATTAVLSWHVQQLRAIWWPQMELGPYRRQMEFELWWIKCEWDCPAVNNPIMCSPLYWSTRPL